MIDLKRDSPAESDILQRIDAIMHELQELRAALLWQRSETPAAGKAQELFGALGQGTWDEYDPDLDWQRFTA